jgi:O-succinylbenzoic acid--CoA ligase
MAWLVLNGRKYSSLEDLQAPSIQKIQTEFEKSTISFCRDWLSGKDEFKLKTSGSTGAPKEIILKRSAMEASALQTIKALQLKSGNTALVCLDTKYIAGQMMLVRSFVGNMNIIAVEPSANPLEGINQQVDFVALVPYQVENILVSTHGKLNQVACAIIGGAAVSNSLRDKIRKSKCAFFATYGMTETISHVALQKLNGENAQDYFELLENIHVRLDERGCLCIKADYLGDEIVTNDLVELIDEKKFKWLGRVDNVINSGGVKIIPEKVEAVFEKIFNTLQIANRFFVAPVPDEKLGQRAVVVFEGEPLDQEFLKQISNEAAAHLAKYEIPKDFVFKTKFVEAANGKINRHSSLATNN